MLVKDLGGHSGCRILLYEENGIYFVRKYSGSKDYNLRLVSQCTKQQHFQSDTIKVPKVLNSGYDENGLFYFDMEYIQGVTLSKFITKIDVSDIQGIVSTIIGNLQFETVRNHTTSEIFTKKISELEEKTKNLGNGAVKQAISILKKIDWAVFPNTMCHGDLTFENIIISNKEIYFIDFLDSFYDSWLLDVGKLFQDLECMWSYRDMTSWDANTKIRLVIFKQIILNCLKQKNSRYVHFTYAALLLHLVRIYPYSKDSVTLSFLDQQVERVSKILGDDK